MSSFRWLCFGAAALGVCGLAWRLMAPTPAVNTPATSIDPLKPTTTAPAIAVLRASPTPSLVPSSPVNRDSRRKGSPLAAELNAPGGTPQADVQALHGMLRQYLRLLKSRPGLPIGNDSDLARVLTGHNPMKLVVLPSPNPALSADGRLRDRWGTPYFIHPQGANAFEIRSAGPDRRLFTPDDVLAQPGAPQETEP